MDRLHQLQEDVHAKTDMEARREIHRALANPKRLLVTGLLARTDELCACEVQAVLNVTHATVSHHMDQLVDAGLVAVERRGRWAYYELTSVGERWAP